MIRRALSAGTVLAAFAVTRLADAHAPNAPDPWWLGLDVARSAPAS